MARIARKSDGRRIFTDEFKRKHIARVHRGELSVAELSRKLGIARSLLQRWKKLMPRQAGRNGITAERSMSRGIDSQGVQYIRELQLLVGKQTVELELLRAELDALKKARRSSGTPRR